MGDTKRCPSCGADVPSGNAFCGQCGTKVHADLSVRYCEDCGARIPEGDIFCGICGTSATTPSANNARQTKLAELWVGDCFTFGTYRQGANGEVAPIEWQILQRDDDGLLIISKYALDYQPYHNRDGNVTWSMVL